jgi:hypothetical protein
MPNPIYAAYEAANSYFDLVRGALGDLVDGEHFFDIVAGVERTDGAHALKRLASRQIQIYRPSAV